MNTKLSEYLQSMKLVIHSIFTGDVWVSATPYFIYLTHLPIYPKEKNLALKYICLDVPPVSHLPIRSR